MKPENKQNRSEKSRDKRNIETEKKIDTVNISSLSRQDYY